MAIIDNPATIVKGGSEPTPGPLDPEQVYRDTRPSEWMTMPTPSEDEIYLLLDIPTSNQNETYRIQIPATSSGTLTLEFGSADSQGVFTAIPALTVTGTGEVVLEQDVAISNWTSIGTNEYQLMVKLSSTSSITEFQISKYGKNYKCAKFIVDAALNVPMLTTVYFGSSASGNVSTRLTYARFYGTHVSTSIANGFYGCKKLKAVMGLAGTISSCSGAFNGCADLVAIPDIDTSVCASFANMFSSCFSIEYVPLLDTSSGTNFSSMFNQCYSLKEAPAIDVSRGTNFSSMFASCTNVADFPVYDTSSGTDFTSMFSGCVSLVSLKANALNFNSATTLSGMFSGCHSLISLNGIDMSHSSKVTTFSSMFAACISLTDISPVFDFTKATSNSAMQNMFSNSVPYMTLDFGTALFGTDGYTISTGTSGGILSSYSNTASTGKIHVIFRHTQMVALSVPATTVFSSTNINVYVPDNLVSTYKANSRWSTISARIFGISDYPVNS